MLRRCFSSFRAKDIKVYNTKNPKPKPKDALLFGKVATDHMLEVKYANGAWGTPVIRELAPINIHPMAKVLHYCPTVFEGLKAFRGVDNEIRLFRIDKNMQRMVKSAQRSALPEFCPIELERLIELLVRIDQEWVPSTPDTSLYIRPVLIGTDPCLGVSVSSEATLLVMACPVGSYYSGGGSRITLYADPTHIRSAPGGTGAYKMGCNYAPSVQISEQAKKKYGCDQVLWLDGPNEAVTEAGTSNIFIYWKTREGELELVTPPLEHGLILPGVTRDACLELARGYHDINVVEKYTTIEEIQQAKEEKRLLQVFGTGTAAVISDIGRIVYIPRRSQENYLDPSMLHIIDVDQLPEGVPDVQKRLYDTITGIQYGRIARPDWTRVVDG